MRSLLLLLVAFGLSTNLLARPRIILFGSSPTDERNIARVLQAAVDKKLHLATDAYFKDADVKSFLLGAPYRRLFKAAGIKNYEGAQIESISDSLVNSASFFVLAMLELECAIREPESEIAVKKGFGSFTMVALNPTLSRLLITVKLGRKRYPEIHARTVEKMGATEKEYDAALAKIELLAGILSWDLGKDWFLEEFEKVYRTVTEKDLKLFQSILSEMAGLYKVEVARKELPEVVEAPKELELLYKLGKLTTGEVLSYTAATNDWHFRSEAVLILQAFEKIRKGEQDLWVSVMPDSVGNLKKYLEVSEDLDGVDIRVVYSGGRDMKRPLPATDELEDLLD
ncbi:MAG: hypothetical protein R3B54_04110 [Bdellovibrionota bacterium]